MKKLFVFAAFLLPLIAIAQTESEPNGSFGSADAIVLSNQNGSIEAMINPVNDIDFFEFPVMAGEVFSVRVTNVPANIRMRMTVYLDETQLTLTGGGQGEALTINRKVCSNGTVALRLEDNSFTSQASSSQYRITVEINNEDIYECNDQFSDATPLVLATPLFAQINDIDDVDYYSFELASAGVITAQVLNVPSEIALTMEMYDSNQERIAITGDSEGQPVSILKKVCKPGTYYLLLEDRSFTRGASTDLYRLTVTLDTDDVYECNDQFSDAAPITLGDPVFAQINDFDDVDFFRVEITEKGVFSARVINVPAFTNIYLDIFNADMEEVGRTSGGNGESVFVAEQVCEPGTYFVKIEDRSFSPSASEDLYQLTVSLNSSDIYECNDDNNSATDIAFCTPLSAYLNIAQDKDYFQFSATEGDFIVISMTGFSEELLPRLSLTRANDNATIAIETGDAGEDLIITNNIVATGDYYILIEERSSSGFSDTPYELEVERGQECWPVSTSMAEQLPATSLYPNPTTSQFNLDLSAYSITIGQLALVNANGQRVLNQQINVSQTIVDISSLPKGLYFVEFTSAERKMVGRIVRK